MERKKTILITGATDGIGKLTAYKFIANGHRVLVHGRSAEKLAQVEQELSKYAQGSGGEVQSYKADFSNLREVRQLAKKVLSEHLSVDVLINNAGVFKTQEPITSDGYDVRFVVNVFAPYVFTEKLKPLFSGDTRILNLSSAAQASVQLEALSGAVQLDDYSAYAQSKMAVTMWSKHLATEFGEQGPVVMAVNPGSLLGTKMVKEGFNTQGKDINIGADILAQLALDETFKTASGQYFDNDAERFSPQHMEAFTCEKMQELVEFLESVAKE